MHHRFRRLMAVLTGSTRHDLRRQVQFLKAENEVLRSRIKGRIRTTPRERARLVKLGKPAGSAVRSLITLVSPRTFAKWVSSARRGRHKKVKRRPGRPRTREQVVRVVLRLARETDWGLTRIRGELLKLGIRLSRSGVSNILKEHGIEPAPQRGESSWDQFLKRHAKTLWACDFLGTRVLTTKGIRYAFALVFIHVSTRRAFVSAATTRPDDEWRLRAVRAFMASQSSTPTGLKPGILIRDRDSKFGPVFDAALKAAGVTPLVLPPRSPNLNAFAERLIQSVRRECLDRFVVLGLRHLDHLLAEYIDYHSGQRPHSSLGGKTPTGPPPVVHASPPQPDRVRCHQRLGGVIRHYYLEAA